MEWIGDLERGFASTIYPNRVLVAALAIALLVVVALVARRRRWDRWARRRPRLAGGLAAVAVAAAIPLAWYLGSPLFLSTTVNEPVPVVIAVAPSAVAPSTGPSMAEPTPVPSLIERAGPFTGSDDFHFGRGTARLIETSPGAFVVRLEEFAVRNGPDLHVYLSPSADGYAKGAVELGRLKADRGNQNYAVAAGTDTSRAGSVVIWCKQFSVLFATARLS
jgi:electron transfer DM13